MAMGVTLPRLAGPLLVLAVGVLLAMNEVRRIAGEVVTGTGATFSITDVIGFAAIPNHTQWSVWQGAATAPFPGILIQAHVLLDIAFVLLYSAITLIVSANSVQADDPHRAVRIRVALGFLIAAEAVEDTFLYLAAARMTSADGTPEWMAWTVAIAATAKWLFTLGLIWTVLRGPRIRQALGRWLRQGVDALYAQSLSTVVVLAFVVLMLVPAGLVLEQLPDMVRSWFDDTAGAVQGVLAGVALIAVAAAIFVFGRKRAELYYGIWVKGRTWVGNPPDARGAGFPERRWPGTGRYLAWFAAPAFVFVVGGIRWLADQADPGPDHVDAVPFWLFVGITTLIPAVSLVIEAVWTRRTRHDARGPRIVPRGRELAAAKARAARVARAGDTLAVVLLIVGGLALVRSVAPYLALMGEPGTRLEDLGGYLAVFGWSLAVSAALALAPWFFAVDLFPGSDSDSVAGQLSETLNYTTAAPEDLRGFRLGTVAVGGAFAVVLFALIILIPRTFGGAVGGVALMILIVGSWTTLVGLASLGLRGRRPFGVFAVIGLKSVPVTTMAILLPLLVAQLSGTSALHAVNENVSAQPDRRSLEQEFDRWLERSGDCAAPDGVKPLILVAAEGGGIRAATWTTAVMDQLWQAGRCVRNSVFLSSGVSGGSVGLAIASNASPRSQMLQNARDLGTSDALPAAIEGLTVIDPIASTTGVRLPNAQSGGRWEDRASLIEHSWRVAVPELGRAFTTRPAAPTGLVVLNGTDLLTSCRVAVSQVILDGATGPAADGECSFGTDEPALTIDLLSRFGPQPDKSICPSFDADWATAAMLSARFPVVTPAGGIHRGDTACPGIDLQVVDGGYAENTGLGLLADIAPRIASIVREHNSSRSPDEPLVVPYLMYIQNSPGGYLREAPEDSVKELLVPIAGQATKEHQVAASSWIQRIMSSLAAVCNPGAARCAAPPATADRVAMVAISTKPSVSLPLGWAMSHTTFDRITEDAATQATESCVRTEPAYACLSDVVEIFD